MTGGDARLTAIILAGAVVTYLTRVGGYVLVSRMDRIPRRLEAALDAVPAAVLTTLVAPAFIEGGTAVGAGLLAALLIGLRWSSGAALMGAWAVAMGWRHVAGG